MIPRVWADVSVSALRHNMQRVRTLAPQSRVMAVIKANGYGHGAVTMARGLRELRARDDGAYARAAHEADCFAVACLEEALALRAARVQAPIVLLEGVLSLEEARLCVREGLEIVLHDHWQLALLTQLPRGAAARIWIKVDTGMHRLGVGVSALPDVLRAVRERPEWQLQGVMTHLASADDDPASALAQAARFDAALAGERLPRSLANSAGVLADARLHADWVRPGLMLYGISPCADKPAATLGLQPVMTLRARILSIRDCAPGDAVGYGASYVCTESRRIAVITVGYADGFQRALGNVGRVRVHEQLAPVVGRVSMDMTAIDVSAIPQAAVGDVVTLWGAGLPAEDQASAAGTIAYELCCGLTGRVRLQTDEALTPHGNS